MQSPLAQLTELGTLFGTVASTDPLSSLLLLLGAVITVGSAGFFGLLALGAVLDLATPA